MTVSLAAGQQIPAGHCGRVPRGMLISVIRIATRGPPWPIDGTLKRANRLLMVPLYWRLGDKNGSYLNRRGRILC